MPRNPQLARQEGLLADEHFTVDGTMIERVLASLENFGGQRETKHRGEDRVGWNFLFALAFVVRVVRFARSAHRCRPYHELASCP